MLVWVIAVIAVLQPKALDLCLKIKQCSSFVSKQVTQILVSTERATLTQNFTYTVSAKILRVRFLQWFVLIIYIKLNLTLMNVSPSFFKSQKCCWIQIQNQLIFLLEWYFFSVSLHMMHSVLFAFDKQTLFFWNYITYFGFYNICCWKDAEKVLSLNTEQPPIPHGDISLQNVARIAFFKFPPVNDQKTHRKYRVPILVSVSLRHQH